MENDWMGSKETQRTSTGLLLCFIGFALSWIPYIMYLGGLLVFIGFIYLLLGRDVFGSRHSSFVVLSFVLFLASIIVGFILGLGFISSVITNINNASGLEAAFRNLLLSAMITGIIGGLYQILGALDLSDKTGKFLLIAGFVLQVAIGIAVYLVFLGPLQTAVSQTISQHSTVPLASLQAQLTYIRLVDAFPALIFAVSYYMARGRILRGIIPKSPEEPASF